MLKLHFLDVEHGDSCILERQVDGRSHFGLIDTNLHSRRGNVALDTLVALGASRLSFVVLTHPHVDHYLGMSAIFERFGSSIANIYTYPIERDRSRIEKLAGQYHDSLRATDSRAVSSAKIEFIRILKFLDKCAHWEMKAGRRDLLIAPGFDDVEIHSVMPPASVRGPHFKDIDDGVIGDAQEKNNDLSIAVEVRYAGKQVILGGDGTAANWAFQHQRLPFDPADIAKLPHHGSRKDCSDRTLDILFGAASADGEREQIAVVSAEGGPHHPHDSVLNSLVSRRISPYCTNISQLCSMPRTRGLVTNPDLDPVLNRFLNAASSDTASPKTACQGDITISIDPHGGVLVDRQVKAACPLRGEVPFLALS